MMPQVADRWAKDRPANYFDDMLQNKTMKLFQKYSVHAADNPEGYTVATTDINDPSHKGQYESGSVPGVKRISWIHLEKTPRRANYIPGTAELKEGGDTIDCKASIAAKANWVPAWFLPWKPQAMIYMTIPPRGVGAGGHDPDIFFTAAINGCSVFFQGTAQNPTIYHCGGDPDYRPNPKMKTVDGIKKPVRDPSEAAAFWRTLVMAHGDMTKGVVGGEVNKIHYLMDTPTADASQKNTARSEAYFKWLKKNNLANKDQFRFLEVRPWGCVFGVRTGNDWQFYLQENATIRYTSVQTTRSYTATALDGPLGIHAEFTRKNPTTRVDVNFYDVARPTCVRPIWPNGGGGVAFRHPAGLELL
jgi:hypothetical protein